MLNVVLDVFMVELVLYFGVRRFVLVMGSFLVGGLGCGNGVAEQEQVGAEILRVRRINGVECIYGKIPRSKAFCIFNMLGWWSVGRRLFGGTDGTSFDGVLIGGKCTCFAGNECGLGVVNVEGTDSGIAGGFSSIVMMRCVSVRNVGVGGVFTTAASPNVADVAGPMDCGNYTVLIPNRCHST